MKYPGIHLKIPWPTFEKSQCTFVGGGVLFVGTGFSFVGAVVPCRVVTVSEIRWDLVLTDDMNKNDKRQHHGCSLFISTSLSATWHLEPPLWL
jgi:hypothetical protein